MAVALGLVGRDGPVGHRDARPDRPDQAGPAAARAAANPGGRHPGQHRRLQPAGRGRCPADRLVPLARACESQQLVRFPLRRRRRASQRAPSRALPAGGDRATVVPGRVRPRPAGLANVPGRPDAQPCPRSPVTSSSPGRWPTPARLVADALSAAPVPLSGGVQVAAPAADVEQRVPPTVGVVRPRAGGRATLQIGADDFEFLRSGWSDSGLPFEVLEPVELREQFRVLGEALHRRPSAPPA